MLYPLTTYYPLSVGNRWYYTAPPRWGGDYISRIEEGPSLPLGNTVRHFDAQLFNFRMVTSWCE